MTKHENQTLAGRWSRLDNGRANKLHRARRHAELTIPSLLPRNTSVFDAELPVPYNGLPAEAVNSLAAKAVSVLFPLNDMAFFEMLIPQMDPDEAATAEVQERLRAFERMTMDRLYASNLRAEMHTALAHLLVVGDVLMMQEDDFDFRLFRLDQYVVLRYNNGKWYEIITREAVDPDNPPPELEDLPAGPGPAATASVSGGMPYDAATGDQKWLYTQIKRESDGTFSFVREYNDIQFDKQTLKISPYIPLRWRSMAGEHYGRSEIEDAFGDVVSIDSLTKNLNDGSDLNAEYRWELDPFSLLSVDDFMDSVNGDVLPVREGELRPAQFQNHSQIAATQQSVNEVMTRLGRRFLMNQAVQPTGERVTARQVSILAQEIEAALGGMLSIAAREIQIPVVRNSLSLMARKGQLPPDFNDFLTEEDLIDIRIRAGLEVLKREADSERLNDIMDRASRLPEQAQQRIEWGGILQRWIISTGISPSGLVKTDEQMAAEQSAQQMEAQAGQMQQMAQEQMQGARQ